MNAPARSGVTRYDQAAAANGFNFYTSGHEPGAVLMNMQGEVVHRWHLPFDAIAPAQQPLPEGESAFYWRRAHLFENGDVLAIFEGLALVKVDRHSRVLWFHAGGEHHDLDVTLDGRIHVLTRRARRVGDGPDAPAVLEDAITVLAPSGEELAHISLLDAVRSSDVPGLEARLPERGDLLHTNSLEILDGRLADQHPAFRAGNALVSFRTLDTIAVVDTRTGALAWTARGSFRMQHHPTVLEDRILLFDNAPGRGRSSVLELDPLTLEERAVYRGNRDAPFFSNTCGSAYRLPGGNTLITESDAGRAIEVNDEGTILWEYLSPHRATPDDTLVATLFDLIRLPADFPVHWILGPEAAQGTPSRRASSPRKARRTDSTPSPSEAAGRDDLTHPEPPR